MLMTPVQRKDIGEWKQERGGDWGGVEKLRGSGGDCKRYRKGG